MARERELDRGREDPQLARRAVVDEDGLGVAQVGGDGLAVGGRRCAAPSRKTPSGLPPSPSGPRKTRSVCRVVMGTSLPRARRRSTNERIGAAAISSADARPTPAAGLRRRRARGLDDRGRDRARLHAVRRLPGRRRAGEGGRDAAAGARRARRAPDRRRRGRRAPRRAPARAARARRRRPRRPPRRLAPGGCGIAAFPSAASVLVPPAVAAFRAEHPEVELSPDGHGARGGRRRAARRPLRPRGDLRLRLRAGAGPGRPRAPRPRRRRDARRAPARPPPAGGERRRRWPSCPRETWVSNTDTDVQPDARPRRAAGPASSRASPSPRTTTARSAGWSWPASAWR